MTGMADVTVRAMREEDAADLFALYNQPAFRNGTLALPFESFEAVKAWATPRSPRDVHIVAEMAGRVVGAAGLRPFYGRRAHAAEFWIGVNEEFSGRGIGRQLLAALIDTADNWLNILRIEMTVFVDNARAIALYERFGFVIEGTHRAASFRDGAFVDVHCMARLRPGTER